ncbi:histidinol-phosphate aminotransferase [Halobacteroides halobius DSM 5150]|uniref:Histidinol-phosphate aminotransferase n=1 Tax=Halobacteroides halobius (strain ATCC 35273 / DSM 5150 / MD-1) TaxID=748449 RepID=L0KB99_HALHC|nr:histidinol-phosphate transaminase [Halobacteroides halobius]AGB41353.1 histidinol-phosphate aminotransferase [Halobacteroides halobius DSM 5150]
MVAEKMVRKAIMNIKPYVPGKPIEEVKRELGLDKVIKLASNENPLGTSPTAVEKMQERLERAHIYPDGNAYSLRAKLSSKLEVAQDQLIFGNGSDELLAYLGQTFIKSDDEVIMAETTFSEYEFTTNLMGGNLIKVPLKDYKHDLEEMVAAITEQTKMIFVCNPNNPTGTIVTSKEVEEFLEQVPDDVVVVFDEAYYEYVTNDDYPETIDYLSDYDNLIILRTFSKAYGLSGLRIGYGISNPELIDYLKRVRQPFNVNEIAQVGAYSSLDDKKHLEKTLEYNNQGKEYLYQQFEELGLDYIPTESNFIIVDVEESNDQIFDKLLKEGVIIRSLSSFGYQTKIRVTVGLPEENKAFIEALKKVL